MAATIRAMSNFGLSDLRLVEPAAFDPHRILGIAHGTERLVESARRCATLDEALADCTLVLATTGRPRQGERRVLEPREAARLLLDAAEEGPGKVAVLFGPEQDGLPTWAVDRCQGILTIPTDPYNRSLNLAQAVLLVAWELWMAAGTSEGGPATGGGHLGAQAPPIPPADLASGAEREAMFTAFQELLTTLYPGSTELRMSGAMARLRALLNRGAPTREEAKAMTNLIRHADRTLKGEAAPRTRTRGRRAKGARGQATEADPGE